MGINTINTVFLGIDVHKRTYSVTAVSENQVIKKTTMAADPVAFLTFIHNFFPNSLVYSAYEAGFSGFGLHRFLIENGVNNIVVHAASIEVVPRNKSKTDKRDSKKIAFHLSYGRLQCVHIPSVQRESWRSVTRLRSQFVKDRARISNRIKGLLFYFGILLHSHKGKASRKWIRNLMLNLQNINPDVFFCIKNLTDQWIFLDDKVKEIEVRLKEQAKKDSKIGEVYQHSYGIGLISSRILANELDNLSHFNNESALYSYTGLTPCEHSSGDRRHLGNISRQGNPIIRGILTEAAWKAIKKDADLEKIFERLVKNTGSRKKAILGIARRMIGRTRAEFRKGNKFVRDKPLKKEAICIS